MKDDDLGERIRGFLDAPEARTDLHRYFEPYSGRMFETIGGRGDVAGIANRFTPPDLVAVTTLSVQVSGHGAIEILEGERASTLSELFEQVPVDVDLWDAGEEDLANLYELQDELDGVPSVGHVTRSKLLARKRLPQRQDLRTPDVKRDARCSEIQET